MNGQRAERDERETQEKTCAKDALAQQRARMDASSVGKRLWRLAVTGRRDMRVRDFVRVPRVVKQIDKYSFTLGVAGVVLSHHLVIVAPELFWAWYSASISSLLSHRLWSYRRKKWSVLRLRSVAQQSPTSPDSTKDKETLCRHYFMLDFCYYANALCLLNIFLLPSSTALFMVNFCFSNGPLLLVRSLTLERSTQHPLARSALNASLPSQALVAWRNSLVFHDIDKVTSVFLHALPSLLSWCWRWHGLRTLITERSSSDESNVKSAFFYVPLSAYLLWQFAYLTWTEVVAKEKLDSDPDLITSLRWLAADDKQPMNRMATKALRRVRILGPHENFDPNSAKTKTIFVVMQLILTLLSLLPMPLLYHYKRLHALVLISAFLQCTWNGASYYIEVFSRRYVKKFGNDGASGQNSQGSAPPHRQQQNQSAA